MDQIKNDELANFIEHEIVPKWNKKFKNKMDCRNHIQNLRTGQVHGQHMWNNIATIMGSSYYLLGLSCKHHMDYCAKLARCGA
jgi:hypothetical protein